MAEIHTERCNYQSPHGEVGAYLAQGGAGPWPAVVVIHDRYGLWEHIEETARDFAEAGYVALAPDLNWRDVARRALADDDVHEGGKVLNAEDPQAALAAYPAERRSNVQARHGWLKNRKSATHLDDTLAGIAFLKARPDVLPGRGGLLRILHGRAGDGDRRGERRGYCRGGDYYGIFTDPNAQAPECTVPGSGPLRRDRLWGDWYGARNRSRDEGQRQGLHAVRLCGHGHAFADHHSETSYGPESTRLAWERTLAFFAKHLKRAAVPSHVNIGPCLFSNCAHGWVYLFT